MSTTTHRWRFFLAGGVTQVRMESAEDLRNLRSLDPTLWVALSCPVAGHAIDERTMALIDSDGDGRVRVAEILAAVDLVDRLIRDPADILGDPSRLPLACIRDDRDEARQVFASARSLLSSLGKADADEIAIGDLAQLPAIHARMPLNGDGVVPPGATNDLPLAELILEIVATFGGVPDRNGEQGVSAETVEAFFAACVERAAWHARALTERDALFPLGDETAAAAAATLAVAVRVDDFFARCKVAAFDARHLPALNGDEPGASPGARVADPADVAHLPLARIDPAGALPLTQGLNPAWAERMRLFREFALGPILGGDQSFLVEAEWLRVNQAVGPYLAWQAVPGGLAVRTLGADRVHALLAGDAKAQLLALIAADEAMRPEVESAACVEQVLRYYMHLGCLLRNFVNFSAFYGRREKAIFQAGTAYFDQRSCDLVLRVGDAGRHATMAGLAGMYLAYMECTRKSDGRCLTACVVVTDGDSDNLMIGRNGLFYDREGRDYDARITKIVDNPISLRQAFWSPYKKFIRAVEELVAKRATAADAESNTVVNGAAETTANADRAAPTKKAVDVGTVAAIGVAVGGISAAIGALLQAFFGLGVWMPLGVAGLVLLISGPSMLIAALKLRRRNLGPILDADGWAVNAKARINIPFGRSLTRLATLPPGASCDLDDPFGKKKARWPYVVAGVLILAMATFTAVVIWKNTLFLPS